MYSECPEENRFPCKDTNGAISCISELQYCDGVRDCTDGSDEPSDCYSGMNNTGDLCQFHSACLAECSRPGQIRLVNGAETDGHEGRVEVCFKGQWGSICQDLWDYFDTEVACRQLGLGTIGE